MNTRFDERTVKVTDAEGLQEYLGRGFQYFAKTHYKVWNEDFLDQDTGEIVSVERTLALYQKGRMITADETSTILFHLQTGDLKEIWLSNQSRMGAVIVDGWANQLWVVKLCEVHGKTRQKILTHAASAEKAIAIVRDWVELNHSIHYEVASVKNFDTCIIIDDVQPPADEGEETEQQEVSQPIEDQPPTGAKRYYKTTVRISYGQKHGDENEYNQEWPFIVSARDMEETNEKINKYLTERVAKEIAEDGKSDLEGYKLTTIDGSPISCNIIIPNEFSEAYAPKPKN